MIIRTGEIQEAQKIISAVTRKGSSYADKLYLCFKDKKLAVQNESVICTLPLNITSERGDDDFGTIAVDADKFLLLTKSFKKLTLNNNYEFSVGRDTFKIEYEEVDFEIPDMEIESYEHTGFNVSENDEGVCYPRTFREALTYADIPVDGQENSLSGIFIRDGSLISSNRYTLYEAEIDGEQEKLDIPYNAANLIPTLYELAIKSRPRNTVSVEVYTLEGGEYSMYLLHEAHTDIRIRIAENMELDLGDAEDEDFSENYDHDEFIIVNRGELQEVLEFITPFVRGEVNAAVQFSLNGSELSVTMNDSGTNIERIIDIESSNEEYFDGHELWVDATSFRTVLSHLPSGDKIKIQISTDEAYPVLNLTTMEYPGRDHIIYCRLATNY